MVKVVRVTFGLGKLGTHTSLQLPFAYGFITGSIYRLRVFGVPELVAQVGVVREVVAIILIVIKGVAVVFDETEFGTDSKFRERGGQVKVGFKGVYINYLLIGIKVAGAVLRDNGAYVIKTIALEVGTVVAIVIKIIGVKDQFPACCIQFSYRMQVERVCKSYRVISGVRFKGGINRAGSVVIGVVHMVGPVINQSAA